ncbi:putative transcriptional regulator [Pseudonocardia sp. Ae717_Ps2]|uniref:helix-turn-helix domain-containing protein n=1 Tax=Pseudonocardia sp. Ae717_Ps2 TaxID=1885573 RepID=UPI00094AEE26|nr:helix-turn-helix transcriptional regulator [Pseudonocardia sp. Ae717_Ps2]OLM34771.1 putative transcriptional regulator [Pseudonocardia sp. Ae717_Ps2]
MSGEESRSFGRRVAFLRKKLGYSQLEFARKVDRSETWLSQVERGVRQIDRLSVLERLAAALEVSVAELAPEKPAVTAVAEKSSAASTLALTLASSPALRAMVNLPGIVDLAEVERRAAQAWELTHAARYDALADLLSGLVADVEAVERQTAGDELARARRTRTRVYLAAGGALVKLGEFGAAWVAIDRAATAAGLAGDLLLLVECRFRLAIAFLAARRFDMAFQVADTAITALSDRVAVDTPDVAALSLLGALHLQLAVTAARTGDGDSAYSYLTVARATAERVGEGRNDYNTEFSPTNVELHEVAVAVELGDAGRALRAASGLDATCLSVERQGRLLIDVAAANAQLRRPDAVIAALMQGLAVSPEQVSSHARARTLVADLLRDHGNNSSVKALARQITAS